MSDQTIRCKCCGVPTNRSQLRDLIEKAIRASYELQVRYITMPFSPSDMAADVIDALWEEEPKDATAAR